MTDNETRPSQALSPVAATERIAAVDVVRGLALLGILISNIDFFALPTTIYFDPSSAGDLTGLNLLTWQIATVLLKSKMMALFSMLFGAGLILMHSRAESVGRRFGGIYYRGVFWLLLFGIAHAYLLWVGDILYAYALCGLLLYPLWRSLTYWKRQPPTVDNYMVRDLRLDPSYRFNTRTTQYSVSGVVGAPNRALTA